MDKESRCAIIAIIAIVAFTLNFLLVFNLLITSKVYNDCKSYNCSYLVIANHSNCINYSISYNNQNCYHCLSYQPKNHTSCYTNYVFNKCPINQSCYDSTLRKIQFIVNLVITIVPILLITILVIIIIKNNKTNYQSIN